jgi:hypothetical protein
MSDHHDDDTHFWDDRDWNRTGELPAIRTDDTGSIARTQWLGRLARDVPGGQHATRRNAAGRRTGRHGPYERTRTHHVVTRSVPGVPPVAADDDWAPVDHWVEPEPNRTAGAGVDPRLLRIGAVVGAAVLLVPVVAAIGGGDPDDETLAGGAPTATTLTPPTLTSPTTTTITVPAAEAAAAAAPAAFAAGRADDDEAQAASDDAGDQPEVTKPACAGTYTVIANDFWNRFPKTSGATVEQWLAANNATHDTPLYVGDELCIPAGATAPAPPPQTTAPPTTAAPQTTAAPVATAAPTTAAPATTPATTAPPPPPAPATTAPPAPISAGAPSTEALCGAMPTSNGNPPGTPGPAQVEALIREIWPDELEVRALCIAKREARLRADLNNYCCYGVFAIYYRWVAADLRATFGLDEPSDLYDARTNIALAYQLYLRSGWDPWSQTDPGPG